MTDAALACPLITVTELAALAASNAHIQIIDASWFLAGNDDPLSGKLIEGALEFDLASIKAAPLPEQNAAFYAKAFAQLGADPTKPTIFYDRAGLFSAPRGWYMAKEAGFKAIAVLDGGLPAWREAGYPTVSHYRKAPALIPPKKTSINPVTAKTILRAIDSHIQSDTQIVDARPAARFFGQHPEPRPALRSGHIPSSINLPFGSLKTADNRLLPIGVLRSKVKAAKIDLSQPIITSCGSGVTASGLALIFALLGKWDVSVYSGSWSEWGAEESGLPISTHHSKTETTPQ